MLGHWGHVTINLCVSAGERVSAAPTLARSARQRRGKLVVQCTVIAHLWEPFKPKYGLSSIIISIGKSLPAEKNHSSPLVDASPLVPVYYSLYIGIGTTTH